MRVAIVVPSEQYLALAGARIRYQRIAARLRRSGHSLDMIKITEFHRRNPPEHQVYVFSKCYDARSFMTARYLRSHGCRIAVDVFDDYFSQAWDSRFIRHREWLRTIGELCDFFLCSTPQMQEVVSTFLPGKPGHVLNDPFDAFDLAAVAETGQAKLAAARADRHVDVVWFGVGDNPNFPVGLSDLSAFGGSLARIAQRGFTVNLRILTNRRALTVEGLAAIGRLSVPVSVEEWTQEREKELLRQSLLAFIPVNAQPFSIAKSLNRAVTALTGGAQVLSPGYPLYQPLDDFIYHDADSFVDDLLGRRLKVRRSSIRALSRQLTIWGDPDREAEKLGEFLTRLEDGPEEHDTPEAPLIGLIHGQRSPADCHKAAQRLGYLSISSPFSGPGLNYDIRYVIAPEGVQVQVSETAASKISPRVAGFLRPAISPTGKPVSTVSLGEALPGHPFSQYRPLEAAPYSRAAIYAEAIHLVRDATSRLFPDISIYLSEMDPPFTERRGTAAWAPPVSLTASREMAS
jgi:hypothetical protein